MRYGLRGQRFGRRCVRHVQRRAAARTTSVTAVLSIVLCIAFCVSISVGDFPIPLRDVVPAIFGAGDEQSEFIVRTLRLPRALTAVLVGAAFGISGAIFQSVARNPLASPDIIGIDAGASAAAVACIVLLDASAGLTAAGALLGDVRAARGRHVAMVFAPARHRDRHLHEW